MGLSRLNNFLKSTRGTILYVNPNDLDSTDSIENLGNSLTRPFKTIQRALIESARFSYQRGLNNDRFGKTTILVYPGDHIVDNRPGWIPDGSLGEGVFLQRNGSATNDFQAFDLSSNFDLNSDSNSLYKLNSIHGGVIIPRGTSIVGLDLRKTKIRPKYVPNPDNDQIETSSIFRLTGGCYLWQFTILDADPNGLCYTDYTTNKFVPNFSHHKLTAFEYADGTNRVQINDEFIEGRRFERTDLDMYYEKIGLAYGQSSGRSIEPDYPDADYDIQTKIDEYRIVGSTGLTVGITSIKSGDGIVPGTTVTVTTEEPVPGLDVDTAIRVEGITVEGYDGNHVVTNKLSELEIQYKIQNTPIEALPNSAGSIISLEKNTVTSASPYIFNISLRSVYGMSGLHADGSKASGFKSIIIAQFTGIGLQKDDRAFVIFNPKTGLYEDSSNVNLLSNNSRSVYKPTWKNYHIKASNDAFIQCVSIFAIGYAEHFVTETGGDLSITNSNSNFGSKSLVANGFKNDAFSQDDCGYITHFIPPKEISENELLSLEFEAIDVANTDIYGSTGYLYLYNQNNPNVPPETVLEGYRVGAAKNDKLRVLISYGSSVTEYSSRIIMPGSYSGNDQNLYFSSEKVFNVQSIDSDINSSDGIINFGPLGHTLLLGEKIRFFSDTGKLPDGLKNNQVYFAITRTGDNDTGIGTTQIKVAKTLGDALSHTSSDKKSLYFNETGGKLKVISRVSDKNAGEIGHPVQFDDQLLNQWYVLVSTASTENGIYNIINSLGTTHLGDATARTFVRRKKDSRLSSERLYRMRYVIPKDTKSVNVKPPSDGYIIQETNSTIGLDTEITKYFGSGSLSNLSEIKNFRFISNAVWNNDTAEFETELPHNLDVGNKVEIINVQSDSNVTGLANSGYNGVYSVVGINSTKNFSVNLISDPGDFVNNTSTRGTELPYFKRKEYKNTYYIFKSEEIKPFIAGLQDGIYYLTVLNSSVSPNVNYFSDEKYSQPVSNLYPQIDRDNPNSDPDESICFAQTEFIGDITIDDPRKSLTKETCNKFLFDTNIGFGITNIVSTSSTVHTVYTSTNHPFNRVVKVSIANSGSQYGNGQGFSQDFYNAKLVSIGSSVTGKYATAKVTVNQFGNLSNVQIMDGGSAYGIGNTLSVVGIETYGLSGHIRGVVTVDKIYNDVGQSIRISGVTSESYNSFNNLYRIRSVNVGAANSFQVTSASGISTYNSTIGIGSIVTQNAFGYLTGNSLRIQNVSFSATTGIASITTYQNHGLIADSKVMITRVSGLQRTYELGRSFITNRLIEPIPGNDYLVSRVVSPTKFLVNVGIRSSQSSFNVNFSDSHNDNTSAYVYREGLTSNEGVITLDEEKIGSRMIPIYDGITASLQFTIENSFATSITISSISDLNLKIGDFILIDEEILQIKTTIPNNIANGTAITVSRGVLGTKATSHISGSVVRKIKALPIEFRRHSIARASGHTFEYVGFGPGNYSTAFPSSQDRQLSKQEEIISQSTRRNGGVNFYNGMNDRGISYSGNRKLSIVTGQEEIFDTPIQTIVGEDISVLPTINVSNFTEANVENSLRVSGGDSKNVVSEFNGPVIFTNKVTSTAVKGVEMNSLYLQGDSIVSRRYTVGISTPTYAGTPGDIVYDESPSSSGYVGWIYTRENSWYRWGNINISDSTNTAIFEKVGINVNDPGTNRLLINSGTSQFSVTGFGSVGIGTTANQYKLNVNGNTSLGGDLRVTRNVSITGNIFSSSGIITAFKFVGDGSQLTNVNATATGWTNLVSSGIITTYNTYLSRVGIGTSRPRYTMEVGYAGTTATSLWVNGKAELQSLVVSDFNTSGIITAARLNLTQNTSNITVNNLNVAGSFNLYRSGTSNSYFTTNNSTGSIGINTSTVRATLDVEGDIRFNTYYQPVKSITTIINQPYIQLNLKESQNFILTLSHNIGQIYLQNIPRGMTTFTIIVTSTSTRTIDLDDFRTNGNNTIASYWPGGVIPVATSPGRDIYSFRVFNTNTVDESSPSFNSSLITIYAVVVGQNFI